MNLWIRNLGFTLFISVIVSCHKPSDDGPDSDPNNFRISRIVQGAIPSNGKVSVTDFIYDDQQRVAKIVYSSGDSVNGTITTTPIQACTYYYNGTEKNPYKTTGRPQSDLSYSGDVYYYYNNAGQLIRDSLKSTSDSEIATRDYSYSQDGIIVKETTFIGLGNFIKNKTFVVKNHNLTENFYASTSPGTTSYGYRLIYDNKVNPISKLNIVTQQTIDGVNGFPSYLAPGYCLNNITEASAGSTNTQGQFITEQITKFNYTYNKAGLPAECVITTSRLTYTVKYYYEPL